MFTRAIAEIESLKHQKQAQNYRKSRQELHMMFHRLHGLTTMDDAGNIQYPYLENIQIGATGEFFQIRIPNDNPGLLLEIAKVFKV